MSQAGPCGRVTPRWSEAGQSAAEAASIAGLPASRAWVRLGPPLAANGPIRGSMGEEWGLTLPTWVPLVLEMPLPVPSRISLKRAAPLHRSGAGGAAFRATRRVTRKMELGWSGAPDSTL